MALSLKFKFRKKSSDKTKALTDKRLSYKMIEGKSPETFNPDDYINFLKPLQGRLLKALKLDVHYSDGDGNWLISNSPELAGRKVFDATGGYGANLLGHKNKDMIEALINAVTKGPPSHLQGSLRYTSTILAKKISDMLEQETKNGPWVTHFSNTGTEAVEAALKHSLIYYFNKMKNLSYVLQESQNKAEKLVQELKISSDQNEELKRACQNLIKTVKEKKILDFLPKKILKKILEQTDFQDLLKIIKKYNQELIDKAPCLASLEGGFHGKTLGSLKVTSNLQYSSNFYAHKKYSPKTLTLPKDNIKEAESILLGQRKKFITLQFSEELQPIFKIHSISSVACVILEPIQGEAGIYEIPKELISSLKLHGRLEDYLLIFDEIQAGLFRTGSFASGFHSGVTADIYCFSKGLGGGLAKIGVTSIISYKYMGDFGLLHTSTFSEDDLSSELGLTALEILTNEKSPVPQAMLAGKYLKDQLLILQKKYPELIKEIRGKGLMLALEFHPSIRTRCFEFKYFADSHMLGYLFSSALLNQGQLRMAPTLSNPYCLRLEPSLFISKDECHFIIIALRELLKSLQDLNMKYFFSHLYANAKISEAGKIKEGTINFDKSPQKKVAVFLSHAINGEEISKTMSSHKKIPQELIFEKLRHIRDILSFDVSYRSILKDINGQDIEFILLSIPLPSEEILSLFKSPQRKILVEKVQDAVNYAKELGATTVGLGQFTSIVTKNGLSLDSRDMNLTTGNAYTCALSIQATLQAATDKKMDLDQSRIACVGATGNIVSVSASILTEHCFHLSLVYHTPLEKSEKLQRSVLELMMDISKSEATSPCTRGLQKCLKKLFPQTSEEIIQFCQQEEVKKYLSIESDLNNLSNANIIVCGANSTTAIIESQHIQKGAIVIDIAVPRNVHDDVLKNRKDITYILGGVAALPQPFPKEKIQGIDVDFFPLNKGEVFACMAETITLTMAGSQGTLNIGPISKAQVERILQLAKQVGFTLGRYKTSVSY